MAVLMAFFRFMHVAFLLCLRSGSPFVACFMQGRNESDHLDLLAFKAAITSDPFGALNSWNESTHFCQWFGVTCGHRHQQVTVLRLDHQKLSGSISPHIGNLSFLRVLGLRNNSLSGEIPPEVTRLQRLQQMLFVNNTITGEIPANISACSDLITLAFSGNRLTGEIPAELGSLAKLEGLYMAKNNLAGGLPSTLGNLSSLVIFTANYNKIGGSIPDTIGRWKKLKVLQLGVNYLVGTIPFSIYNLSSITDFIVPNNQIEGSLPSDLGITLYNLNRLVLASNLFSGSIPITIVNATRLYVIALAENRFIGKVPSLEKLNNIEKIIFQRNLLGTGEVDDLRFLDTLTNTTRLSAVSLGFNNFGGVLPESISNFSTELLSFFLEKNKLVGSIPSGIGNLINLQFLDLSRNQLSGNVPSDIGKLQKLQALSLFDNKFHGEIPLSFANLTLLVYLQLAQNNLRGNIPSYIGKYSVLQWLLLEHNYLSGVIPKEVSSLPSLLHLWLAYNDLSGSLPLEIGLLQNLEELDVSQNTLVGNLPSSIGSCVKLTSINLEGNKLWGTIPSTFSTLRGLEELDLSHNNLSGKIPDYLDGFVFLKKLNLSFNDFEGALPESGVFKNVTAISIEGNKKLCGGIPELQLQICNSQGSRNKGFTLTMKLIVSISLALLGLLLLSFLILYRFRKTTKVPAVKFFGNSFLQLSYQSLLQATDGFSPANLIGVGSFGSVYKGVFDEGRKVVAVKVLNLRFQGASKSFIAECKALKSIKHRNLVKILTVCASVDYQGNDFKALVYEFMVNGTLEEWLHPNNHDDDAHEESRRLNFEQKLNIAIDVASALNYLHNLCPEPIVHCDLKPSNVLLDEELIAHVGDFGISRFLLEATSDSTFENQSSSIGIRGSIGYTAPEYGTGNEVSPSGDVYSYGVLLLEMFIGKRPTESMFIDSLTLHNFAKMALLEKVTNFVDPTFQQREMEETSSCIQTAQNNCSSSTHKIEECLVSVIKIGIACSHELPTDRMDIKDVVTQLHAIRNTMLETGARSTKLLDDHEQVYTKGETRCRFPLFVSKYLKWPGFVEFDDVNGKVLTYSAQDSIYKVFDLKNYTLLYSISDKHVQEIKIRFVLVHAVHVTYSTDPNFCGELVTSFEDHLLWHPDCNANNIYITSDPNLVNCFSGWRCLRKR